MKYLPLNNEIFKHNRSRFNQALKPNSVAVIYGNPPVMENGDAVYHYKQNSDIYWLTGIDQEETHFIAYPDHPDEKMREILVIRRPNETLEKWEGHKLSPDEAQEISGVSRVIFEDQMDATLRALMHKCDHVYVNSNENDRLASDSLRTDLPNISKLKHDYPLHDYQRASKVIRSLRQIKSKHEVEVIQKAVDITHLALNRVMETIKPGIMEYELEAEIVSEFLRNRATRAAYGIILASGKNACILHYIDNNQECKDGDLILMDFGAEYGGYVSDLSRTIPVNGKYSPRQKEVYDAVLHIHNFAKSLLKPGLSFKEYLKKVNSEFETQLIKLGLITQEEIDNQDPDNPAYRKYYYHGLGHHMGIDVHDIGWMDDTIEEGMVLTVEPGIYIEEENMGVRIENDVVVTKDGIDDLFKEIPITTEEIEAYMNK